MNAAEARLLELAPEVFGEPRPSLTSQSPRRSPAVQADQPSDVTRARAYIDKMGPAIQGSGGDAHTFRVACVLSRDFALDDGTALSLLSDWNAGCAPPWSEEELAEKVRNASRYGERRSGNKLTEHQVEAGRALEPMPRRFALSDLGNAELFAHQHGDVVRFDHTRQQFFVFRSHTWHRDADGEVPRLLHKTVRGRLLEAEQLEDADARKAVAKWAVSSENQTRLSAALAIAKQLRPIADAGTTWDADPMLLGCPNGVVDLRTGSLRTGRPSDAITMRTAVPFDADALCPRWERFISEILSEDEELIRYLRRLFGYSLTGSTSEQIVMILYGPLGSNGKSTVVEVTSSTLGEYALTLPFATFLSAAPNSIPNDLAQMAGRRLITAGEVNEGKRFNESRIKSLSGGDVISARFMRAEFFTFRPVGKLWLSVNHKPQVRDDSHAFWRRVRLLPFLRRFPIDKTLRDTLMAERPGILTWLVRGCVEWQELGLQTPQAVLDATEVYQSESDPLADFIESMCDVNVTVQSRASELFAHYSAWADAHRLEKGERLGSSAFGRRIGERFEHSKDRNGKLYSGVSPRRVTALPQ